MIYDDDPSFLSGGIKFIPQDFLFGCLCGFLSGVLACVLVVGIAVSLGAW